MLFDTLGPPQVNGKQFPSGVVRVRPGKQAEFVQRARKALEFRFGAAS